jgi:hypothetical protein
MDKSFRKIEVSAKKLRFYAILSSFLLYPAPFSQQTIMGKQLMRRRRRRISP